MNAKKYLNSRLGKTIEKMKIAYLSGKHIIFLVTTEPEFVSEVIRSESILPLKKLVKGNGPKDKSEQTNLEFLDNNKELPKIRHLEEPFIFVYQLGNHCVASVF